MIAAVVAFTWWLLPPGMHESVHHRCAPEALYAEGIEGSKTAGVPPGTGRAPITAQVPTRHSS